MDYFASLDPLLRTFWYVAIPVSVVFIVQTIMTFAGTDSMDGNHAVGDSGHVDAPFQLFSLRNLINFFLGFGWTGVSLFEAIPNHTLLVAVSVLVGCSFVYMFFFIITQLKKLAEDNSFTFADTLNKTAEVYVPIPANMAGKGKIMISVNGSYHELEALTEENYIPSGTVVKVVRIDNKATIIVTPL